MENVSLWRERESWLRKVVNHRLFSGSKIGLSRHWEISDAGLGVLSSEEREIVLLEKERCVTFWRKKHGFEEVCSLAEGKVYVDTIGFIWLLFGNIVIFYGPTHFGYTLPCAHFFLKISFFKTIQAILSTCSIIKKQTFNFYYPLTGV